MYVFQCHEQAKSKFPLGTNLQVVQFFKLCDDAQQVEKFYNQIYADKRGGPQKYIYTYRLKDRAKSRTKASEKNKKPKKKQILKNNKTKQRQGELSEDGNKKIL